MAAVKPGFVSAKRPASRNRKANESKTVMKISYDCIAEKQEDGKFLVTFPDFREAFTEGESLEEALI